MSSVGIVGNGFDKFTDRGQRRARALIREILMGDQATSMVSGHSPVGGIDIWAEEVAIALGIPLDLKVPEVNQWDPPGRYGYKARNLDIALADIVYVIVADVYPQEYQGRRFAVCYHHRNNEGAPRVTDTNHVKSGGCWTGKHAANAYWKIVRNYD
jgi:hypothetical protein